MKILPSYWVAPVYEHCGAVAGSLFARLVALSKNNEGCFYLRSNACVELGIKRATYCTAVKVLEHAGLIKTRTRIWGNKTCRFFEIQYSHEWLQGALTAENLTAENLTAENLTAENLTAGFQPQCRQDFSPSAGRKPDDINTDLNTDLHTEIKKEKIIKRKKDELEIQTDISEFKNELEIQKSPALKNPADLKKSDQTYTQADHPTPQTPLASQETAQNDTKGAVDVYTPYQETKINPCKPTCKKSIEYPKTAEEVKACMDLWIEKHAHLDPRLTKLNTALESESFLSYWAVEKQWKRGRTAVKSVEGTIATWLKNSAERVRYTPSKQHKSNAEFLAELEQLNTNQKPIINADAEVISDCEFTEIPEFL